MLPIKLWQIRNKAALAGFIPVAVLMTGCDRDALFDLNEYRQEIEGATQKLGDAIAKLEQTNATLGKLALGINFVVSILEILARGGVVSIAGSISELDNLLG